MLAETQDDDDLLKPSYAIRTDESPNLYKNDD